MSATDRQQQFKEAIIARPETLPEARVAENFGFSNSARIIEGGLFACTNNLESYSANLVLAKGTPAKQFIFLCVLTFPPEDEVYFAIQVTSEAEHINRGLLKLFEEGKARSEKLKAIGKKEGSINNNVKFYITETG